MKRSVFLFFGLLSLLLVGCGGGRKQKCTEAEVTTDAETRVKLSIDVCGGEDHLQGCFFSLLKVVRTDTEEDASGLFTADFNTGEGDCVCKTQVSLRLLDAPDTDSYLATVALDYEYISVTNWGDHVESADVSRTATMSICITTPEGPSSEQTPSGAGGEHGNDAAAAGSDA